MQSILLKIYKALESKTYNQTILSYIDTYAKNQDQEVIIKLKAQ